MNTDFRVLVSLPTHPKALKLMRRCGDIAFYNLIRFWAYVAQNKPDGVLTGLDLEDIEIAAGWSGQCSEYAQALLDLRFIDERDGTYYVHDWEESNGYACHAKKRSERARKAAEARWNSRNSKDGMPNNATSNAVAMPDDATSNAPAPAPTPAPSPSPSPTPVPSPDRDTPPTPPKGEYTESFEKFWAQYPKKVGKDAAFTKWKQIGKSKKAKPGELIQAIILQVQAKHFKGNNGEGDFIPNPSTWLNQGRWKDEVKKPPEQEPPINEGPRYAD